MRFFSVLATAALALFVSINPLAAETHLFTVHDMLAMQRISDPQVSPDGKLVAFVLRTTDLEANRGRYDLWMVSSDGSGLRQLTSSPSSDTNPRWSPDGRNIYFLSTRSGSSQVWRLPLAGGEAVQVTALPLDVSNMIVSPDGTKLAFSLEVFPDAKSIEETARRLADREKQQASGRVYDSLFVRHWDTWSNGTRNHLFVMPVAGGEPVDVSAGLDADAPSKPFGGSEEFAFTSDSKSIVFTARNVGKSEAWSTNFDLFTAPVDGKSAARDITSANPAWDTQPSFSPDGKTLAYLAMARPGYESDRFRIVLRSWPDGATRILTEKWDRSPSGVTWSPDGRTIYTTAENLGQKAIFAIDVKSGDVRPIVLEGTVSAITAATRAAGKKSDQLVYAMNSLVHPDELFAINSDGTGSKQITSINREQLAAARMGKPEQFTFKGANGDTVYGYSVTPADFDPSKKYPVAFLIHGGPENSMGNDFHYRWNPQAYAGRGYAVVAIDFHGSTGYGQAFTDAINGDWGGKPLEDLKKGLAAALDKYKWMDGDRVAALGASYGGYMINWIAGNWPDRFRCLVAHDGNLDERFAYFATEELWFPEWEHGGTPWDNPQGYEKVNPMNYVKNWKTPTLVVHSAQDFRVVETEGLATFTVLQRKGIPSKLLYFPDENHWILKPANSVLWHDTVLDWLDQWTKK